MFAGATVAADCVEAVRQFTAFVGLLDTLIFVWKNRTSPSSSSSS